MYNPYTLNVLQRAFPNILWDNYLSALLENVIILLFWFFVSFLISDFFFHFQEALRYLNLTCFKKCP